MKFVYFGSAAFSRIVLETLCANGLIPALIVSQPDKPRGRGLHVCPTEVSKFALENNIALIKPAAIKTKEIIDTLREYNPDYFIVADYGKILPCELLSVPGKFPLCVHPSILPHYRGPAPVNWALINGETETGVSIFRINRQIDAGEIILIQKTAIKETDDAVSLSAKLAILGAKAMVNAIQAIENKHCKLIPQDESCSDYHRKLTKEDGKIIWTHDALTLRNLVRGCLNWPSAYTHHQKKLIQILKASAQEGAPAEPGTIVKIDKTGLWVAAGQGILRLEEVKPEGKNSMSAYAFSCGHQIKPGDKLY